MKLFYKSFTFYMKLTIISKEKKQPLMSRFYIVFVYFLVVIYAVDLVTKDIYV